jgi:two-component system OmpR family sensor kinase
MLQSERRSFFRFLGIYLSSTFLLFLLGTLLFYSYQKHQIIDTQNSKLNIEAKRIAQALRQLNESFTSPLIYPLKRPYSSAIYNLDRAYIFGSFKETPINWGDEYYQDENRLYHIYALYPYYLGAAYIVVKGEINREPLNQLLKTSLFFLLIAGIFFTLLGLFLGRLFIAPMKESIETMNRFIEDTTHEFNTPISTILTNIELLDTLYDCEGKQEMKRIEIASKTLSRLYEDLTYLKLNHNYHREVISLNFSELIYERIEFFRTLIESKSLILHFHIKENIIIKIDKNDAIRLIDNLLSNAIKYNQKEGLLSITLEAKELSVEDSGVGIKKRDIHLIQNRFKRSNQSEGGFGIGLDIVNQVVQRYHFTFNITSTFQQGTKVTITW